MKIFAKGNSQYNSKMPLPSMVIELGKYLAKNLAGAKVPKRQPIMNAFVVYTTILYMIPEGLRREMSQYSENLHNIEQDIYEMDIYFKIATYRQYIGVGIIQLDENERTLGFLRLEPDELQSLPYCKDKILRYTKKSIEKAYNKYEVLIFN